MSGAGNIKGDGSTSEILYEVKDANRSFNLTSNAVGKHYREAAQQGKEAVITIEFSGYTVDCHITKNV